jgi:hypothetical protein
MEDPVVIIGISGKPSVTAKVNFAQSALNSPHSFFFV